MTNEELTAWVQEDVRKQLKPKKPPPKEPVDPAAKKFFSIHDVPTKASTDVGLRPLDHKVMEEEE